MTQRGITNDLTSNFRYLPNLLFLHCLRLGLRRRTTTINSRLLKVLTMDEYDMNTYDMDGYDTSDDHGFSGSCHYNKSVNYPPIKRRVKCRYCGKSKLRWKNTANGWRLVNKKDKVHNCKEFFAKD